MSTDLSCPTLSPREYIRHPTDIPIRVCCAEEAPRVDDAPAPMHNLSLGGLAFASRHPYAIGEVLHLRIDCCAPALDVDGRVAWCEGQGHAYEVGVAFASQADAYRVRMVEQVCRIEQYRRDVARQEGRHLSSEEAAQEWITRYAGEFAQRGWHAQDEEAGTTHLACRKPKQDGETH